MITVRIMDRVGLSHAQTLVQTRHYLRRAVDPRCTPEAFSIAVGPVSAGVFILGRPEATRCYPWYGSVNDAITGRAECTRWQVLNLARVWIEPAFQPGGFLYQEHLLPGFRDRRGAFRSTLGSEAIAQLAETVIVDYLVRRPPCFLDEPYELRWLLSYCDTRIHRAALYRAAGFELHHTNDQGIQTWRLPLRPLTDAEDARVRDASARNPRSIEYRDRRAQTALVGL